MIRTAAALTIAGLLALAPVNAAAAGKPRPPVGATACCTTIHRTGFRTTTPHVQRMHGQPTKIRQHNGR